MQKCRFSAWAIEKEDRLLHYKLASDVSRPTAAGITFVNDLTDGIEGKNIVRESMLGIRNIGVATWRGIQNIVPIIADGAGGFQKRYNIESREGAMLAGTGNSIQKIAHSVRERSIPRILSTTLAEALDGPVEDLGYNIIGSPKTRIVPVSQN